MLQILGTIIDENFEKFIKNLNLSNPDIIEIAKAIYKFRINEEKVENCCEDLNKLSAIGWNEYIGFKGDHLTDTKNGFSKLIDYLKLKIPNNSIKLEQVVENIDWTSPTNRLTVFDKNENERHTYECSHVICTIPLGFLKKKT